MPLLARRDKGSLRNRFNEELHRRFECSAEEATVTNDFFEAKRPWSKYKDFILGYYLDPYIPKVATLKKPILIVDCFAGCGRFGDGEPGSPLIIAPIIKKWRDKGISVSGEFIEAVPE